MENGRATGTVPYETLRDGLLAGTRDLSGSIRCVFFDYLKAVAAYEEFGPDREKRISELEDAEKGDLFNSVQLCLPWVTDVFIYGILAGEEAQNDAKRALLARYATFPETAAEADRALRFSVRLIPHRIKIAYGPVHVKALGIIIPIPPSSPPT